MDEFQATNRDFFLRWLEWNGGGMPPLDKDINKTNWDPGNNGSNQKQK
jgi:hypothetical protein